MSQVAPIRSKFNEKWDELVQFCGELKFTLYCDFFALCSTEVV